MELRNDDLQPVAQLASAVGDALEESRQQTLKIEDLVKSVAEGTTTEAATSRDDHAQQPEAESEATTLQRENMQLVMEIQRQEFLARKWDGVLEQNKKVVESLISWLRDNSEATTVEYAQRHTESIISELLENRKMLLGEAASSLEDAAKLVAIVTTLKDSIDSDINNTKQLEANRQRLINLFNTYAQS